MRHRNDFNSRFERTQRMGDWMFKFVAFFIGLVFVAIIALWIGYGFIAYKAIEAGPAAIGEKVGEFLKGVEDGRQGR